MGKRYGQHFLHDARILSRIVQAAEIKPGERVLEIGPGRGVLTGRLLEAGARVTAVEIDIALIPWLRERFGNLPQFRLIAADILQADLAPRALFAEEASRVATGGVAIDAVSPPPMPVSMGTTATEGGERDGDLAAADRYAVVANLPYYLSTPLLFRLIACRAQLTRLMLLVQQEVAARLLALPADGKAYGSLSVVASMAFTMRRITRVPPGAFRPPPQVASAVVQFLPRGAALRTDLEPKFLHHVKQLFTQRRKQLLGTLQRLYPELEPAHLDAVRRCIGTRRPDALSPDEHLAVFRTLSQAAGW